jgi:uncharacterized protein YndB with AHSA1/START domain
MMESIDPKETPVELQTAPVMTTAMLIRKPPAEVFEAFADPAITARFWFSRGSGRLAPGATIRWDWEMYGFGVDVAVKAIEPGRRILIEWGDPADITPVEWLFEPRGEDRTLVTITNSGFGGTADEQVAKALDSMGGFSLVLAGAKAWLEHGLALNVVPDRHPDAIVSA